jgi:hypothetical protein
MGKGSRACAGVTRHFAYFVSQFDLLTTRRSDDALAFSPARSLWPTVQRSQVRLRYRFLRPATAGQRDKRPTTAVSLRRMVAIEVGMCRSGREGGSWGL